MKSVTAIVVGSYSATKRSAFGCYSHHRRVERQKGSGRGLGATDLLGVACLGAHIPAEDLGSVNQ